MSVNEGSRDARVHRVASFLERVETLYLRILRTFILILATILLVYAGWLATSSLYKISRSPASVIEKAAAVEPDELTDAQLPEATAVPREVRGRSNPAHRQFYSSFVDRYYALYRAKFEPYRKREDKQLTKAEFDGAFLNTADRQSAVGRGELDFTSDSRDLETLLPVMASAADKPATINRLNRYRSAKKVAVREKVQRTRVDYVDSWDSDSTCALIGT